MINKIKSISKRTLALLLTLLMLLSSGIVGTLAANVELVDTGVTITSGVKLYFKPTSGWGADGARYAAYFCNGSTAAYWYSMQYDSAAGAYYAVSNGNHKNVIFCRMNGANTTNGWENCWNQTGDLTYDGTHNLYTLPSGGQWNKPGDKYNNVSCWSTYTPIVTYTVKKSETNGPGTVKLGSTALSTTGTSFNSGTYDLSITAPTGYKVKSVSVSGGSLSTTGTTGSNTYTGKVNVTAATTITVTYEKFTYTVKKSETNGPGTVKLGTTEITTAGTSISYGSHDLSITAPAGYKVSTVSVTGGSLTTAGTTGSNTYTGKVNVTAATTINVTYAKVTYTVSKAETGGTGTVKLGTTAITTAGTSVSYGSHDLSITAPDGYIISAVSVSGGSLTTAGTTGSNTYTGKVNVTAATTINVTYAKATYTVSKAETGGTGTITLGGTTLTTSDTTINYGSYALSITAPDGYIISAVSVSGGSLTTAGTTGSKTYTGTVNVTADTTINVTYTETFTLTVTESGGTGVKVDNTTYTSVINTYKGKTHSVSVGAPTYYYIKSLKVDGVDVPADQYSNVWTANFTVTISADTVIDVEFAYNPTVGADLDVTGGKVTVETGKRDVTNQALPVTYKANVPYEITAPTGYYINEVKVDDTVVFTASANQYELVYNGTIANITANKTITVDFEKIPTLTITVVADTTNGNVTPGAGTYERQVNEVINFTATPNNGYFVEWHVDGSKVGTGTTYNHTVTKSSTVEAKFVAVPWTGEVYLEIASGLCSNDWKNGSYAYATDNSLGGWPGTEMTYVETLTSGNKVYVVNGVAPLSTLVFKAKDVEMQTKDIVMEANKNYYKLTNCYNSNGWQSTGTWSSEYKYDPDAVMSYVLYGINGSTISDVEKGSYNNATYRGTTTFPTQDSVTKVDTSNPYYARANIAEGQSVEIITTVIHDDFVVDGWVVNGTKFVKATSTGTAKEFRGNIPAEYLDEYTNDAVAVYSHSTTWKTAHPNVDTIQVFADISKIADSTVYKWGEYISAYTWTVNANSGGGYEQFGEWKGQLMIPVGDDQPGVYYTNVEKIGIDGKDVKGIAFTNFGGNSPENPGVGFIQTYDYYEFVTLQDKDNIIYVLQPTDTSVNLSNIGSYTNTSTANNITTAMGLNAPLVDYSNDLIDIYRDVLTEEEVAAGEIGLYVVRTGPNGAGTTTNSETLDGEYYIDCYVYDANRKYIGKCKSFELLDLESLAKTNSAFAKLVNNKSDYEGKIVQVFYEAPNTTNQTRVDGEWYGTDGTQNVTLTTRAALKTDSGYQVADSNEATYGSATIGGQGVWTGPQGTQDLQGAVITDSSHKFIGWYHGTLDANGNVVVDTTKEIISIYTDHKFTAYNNSYYIAVFEELASGTFTVNNFSYEGNPDNPSAPPVYNKIGRDASFRYVKIDKVDSNYDVIEPGTKSDTYFATADVQEDDILKITIYTTPRYPSDSVYAWYMEAPEANGTMNYEEVGAEELAQFGAGEEASFSFYYVITEDYQKNMIIYSDILTKTADITLDYRYKNRYGNEKSYTKTYTLLGSELENNRPSDETIAAYAPYVDDLYKDITWKIKNCKEDATGTRFILEAIYDYEITVDVFVNGAPADTITGQFNEAKALYATTYNSNLTNKGFWYIENGDDAKFTDGEDIILSYGTYYGLVFTKNMTINYVETDKLDFKVVLNSPVYGREQATGGVDKVYTDFIINYLVPYFSGEIINGEQIIDVENKNAPVQLSVYAEAAGVTVEYGMVHQLINTFNDDSDVNETNKNTYFNNEALTTEEIKALESFLESGKVSGMNATGDGQLYNYKYTGDNEDLTNKNRALMTFITNNTANSRNRYYTAVAYLAITDKSTDKTTYYFSNVELFNINDFVNESTDGLIEYN